jgi:hypothetical protein
MKSALHFAAVLLVAVALRAAESKDEVINAAKKLADAPNYSWKTTVVVPAESQFKPGPTLGATEEGGPTHLSLTFRDMLTEAVIKGDKGALTDENGEWESLAELEEAEGPGRFRALMLRNFKLPATQALELANGAKELKRDGDAITGELTDDGAKGFLTFGRGGPNVSSPSGSAKFWIKDGALVKFEFHVKGTVTFNGTNREVDRTTTVEISKVGETKVAVPEAAKKKLS